MRHNEEEMYQGLSVSDRIQARSRFLNSITSAETQQYEMLFSQAVILGTLLHTARQCLELSIQAIPFDQAMVTMWEQGLMLPEEILHGSATPVVRWYIDRLHDQKGDPKKAFAHDIFAIYTALNQD